MTDNRTAYEVCGWADGRLGQAYDLVFEALAERGEQSRNPLLAAIEAYDQDLKERDT